MPIWCCTEVCGPNVTTCVILHPVTRLATLHSDGRRRVVKSEPGTWIGLQHLRPAGNPFRMQHAVLPNLHPVNLDCRIDNIQRNLSWRVGTTGMDMQNSRIAKCTRTPPLKIVGCIADIGTARMNANMP